MRLLLSRADELLGELPQLLLLGHVLRLDRGRVLGERVLAEGN